MYRGRSTRTWSMSNAQMNGELRVGKRTPKGKSRSKKEVWVMALSARGRRVHKAVCHETNFCGAGCWGWMFDDSLALSGMVPAFISRKQRSIATMPVSKSVIDVICAIFLLVSRGGTWAP